MPLVNVFKILLHSHSSKIVSCISQSSLSALHGQYFLEAFTLLGDVFVFVGCFAVNLMKLVLI